MSYYQHTLAVTLYGRVGIILTSAEGVRLGDYDIPNMVMSEIEDQHLTLLPAAELTHL